MKTISEFIFSATAAALLIPATTLAQGAKAGLVSLGCSSKPVLGNPNLDAASSDLYLTPALALARAAAGYQ